MRKGSHKAAKLTSWKIAPRLIGKSMSAVALVKQTEIHQPSFQKRSAKNFRIG